MHEYSYDTKNISDKIIQYYLTKTAYIYGDGCSSLEASQQFVYNILKLFI